MQKKLRSVMRIFKWLVNTTLFDGQAGVKLRGFTLVEIMVVVLIISTLALVTIPAILRVKVNANEAAAQTTLKSISNAIETYAANNSTYPVNTAPLLSDNPSYLNDDYFTGVHQGYSFTYGWQAASYVVTATPANPRYGIRSFTISTGGILKGL